MIRLIPAFSILVVALLAGAPDGARADAAHDVLNAVVQVRAEIPADARSARFLGTEREGNGVVIDDNGLVLTIGYLILEAMAATVVDSRGHEVPAEILAYDYDTGFGLLRGLGAIEAVPIRLGDSDAVTAGAPQLAVGFGGLDGMVAPRVAARREFAGYWEYLLDDAIFTAPPHPSWAGAALVGADGRLVGIGSLLVQDAAGPDTAVPGNMFVPINLLKPILGDLIALGQDSAAPRPWLGMFTDQQDEGVVVITVIPDGPAEAAGVREGDRIVSVAGEMISTMAQLFRKVWSLGSAGVEIPLTVASGGEMRGLRVRSIDRTRFLRLNRTY